MRKLLKKYAFLKENLVMDDLRSYHAAARDLGIEHRYRTGRWRNNRAENSHQPARLVVEVRCARNQGSGFVGKLKRREEPVTLSKAACGAAKGFLPTDHPIEKQ